MGLHRFIPAAFVLPFFVAAPVAVAQDDTADGLQLEEIVVTARKREENLQEIPVAINAFTSEDILAGGLASLEDVSQLASGLYFFNQGQSQPGRYNTQLRFRGLNTAQFSPSFETGALFIDGIYVLNGGTSLSLMDIERVEVIKGPQAALFGRGTFGGAVNFITKDPSLDEFSGVVDVSASERSTYDVNAYVEGPLFRDRLSGSFGFRYYDKEGHYTASDGGRLGDEETITFNGKLFFRPTENFSLSVRAAYSEDDDGAPAAAYIAGQVSLNDSCSGRTITTGAGEVVNPSAYICGQVPDINSGAAVPGSALVDSNTIIPDFAFDAVTSGGLPNGAPFVGDIGLKRETLRLSARATYDIGEYSIDGVVGYNDQASNWVRDFDLSGFSNAYSQDPQGMEDTSYELRITSPGDRRLRWTAGVNYYEQEFISSGAGGNFVFACIGTGNPAAPCVPSFALNFGNSFQNTDESEVTGIFGSVEYDFTDDITAIIEGRHQTDTLTKGGGATAGGLAGTAREVESKEFLPRIILRWQPFDGTTLYASYAEGIVNGDVNQQFVNADDRERAQYLAAFPGLGETTPSEELNAYEFGWKQLLFGGQAYFNLSVYSNEWTGIKGRSSVLVNETCDAAGDNAIGVTGCEYPGVQPGDPKLVEIPPGSGDFQTFFNARNILLDGDADIWGWEAEAGGQITENLSVDASLAYVDSEYTRYIFNFVERIVGFSDMQGNSTPRTPKWSGSLTSTYTFPLTATMNGFVRGDVSYMGEVFTDETNLAFLDSYFLTNVRAGIDTDTYRVELFVKNLFDEDAWATGARFSDTAFPVDFTNFFVQQGVNLTPQNRQEFGIRGIYRF
ncbi:MAG: TonB-dependent receptor [Pseudomonadota bacterium]